MLSLEEIQVALKDRRLSVIADRLGLSYPTVLRVSEGKKGSTYKTICRISDYLESDTQK